MIAEGENPLTNWVNEWDGLGNSYGNGTGAAHYVRDVPGRGALEYHNISSGFHFNPDGSISGAGAKGRSTLEITRNLLDAVPSLYREPMAVMLAGTLGALRVPGAGRSVAQAVSAALVAMDTVIATSLAARISGTSDLLSGLKDINESLIPELREGLEDAQRTVSDIPFITGRDIEECVIVQRLRVEDNVDEDAVAAVNRRIDDHHEAVRKLTAGIIRAADNAVRQDAQWASTFTGH